MRNAQCLPYHGGGAPHGGETHSLLDLQRQIRCNTAVAVPAALQVIAGESTLTQNVITEAKGLCHFLSVRKSNSRIR